MLLYSLKAISCYTDYKRDLFIASNRGLPLVHSKSNYKICISTLLCRFLWYMDFGQLLYSTSTFAHISLVSRSIIRFSVRNAFVQPQNYITKEYLTTCKKSNAKKGTIIVHLRIISLLSKILRTSQKV